MPPLQMASNWQPELKRTWSAGCDSAVREILLSQRGKVAVATAGGLHLYDGPPGFALRHELLGQTAGVTAAAFGAKGADIVAGGADGFLKWWQVDSGDELCSTQIPLDERQPQELAVGDVACSKAGLIAATSGRLLCIFGSGGEHLHTLRAGGDGDGASPPLRHATWLDGASVAAACGPDALVWRVDEEAAEAAGAFATNPAAGIERLALSPDGRYLAAGCANRTVQVWDTQQEAPDPLLVITEGVDAPPAALSWDAAGRLLAAAVGGEALVWDISSAQEGRAEGSCVCGGFEPGARVTRVAFQPNGTLLAVAADDGQCLVFDSAAFAPCDAAPNTATHAASGRLGAPGGAAEADSGASSGGGDAGAVTALTWHSTGSLLLGTATGAVGALQPLRAGVQRAPSEPQGDGAVRRQESAKRRSATQPAAAAAPDAAPQPSAPKAAPAAPRAAPAGWGGEPLLTNGVGSPLTHGYDEAAQGRGVLAAAAGTGMRGRGGRGARGGGAGGAGRYGAPMQHQYLPQHVKRDGGAPGGGAPYQEGGPPKPGLLVGVAPPPQQQQHHQQQHLQLLPGQVQAQLPPEQQAQAMQAAVAAQWGMVPAAMAPQMWRQMQMGYAMQPYGQVVAMPQMGMAPAAMQQMAAAGYATQVQPVPSAAQPGRSGGATYAPRPANGPPPGGRGGGGGGGGGGGRAAGAAMGGAPYASAQEGSAAGATSGVGGVTPVTPGGWRPSGTDARGERPYRRDAPPPAQEQEGGGAHAGGRVPSASGQDYSQQYHQQQEGPHHQHLSRAPSSSSQRYSGPRGGGGGGGGGGESRNGSGGEHQWQADSGGGGGGYHAAPKQHPPSPQQQQQLQQYVPAAAPPGQPPRASPGAAGTAAAAGMVPRSPYGMAPQVYMIPQAGMMPWGMYPAGQMAAYPAAGGGYVMYPAAAAAAQYNAAAMAQQQQQQQAAFAQRQQLQQAGGDGGARGKDGAGAGAARGGSGRYEGGVGGVRYNSSGALSEDSGEGSGSYPAASGAAAGGYQRVGGAYAAGGGGGGYGGAMQGVLTTLYVGNLAPEVDEAALSAHFTQFGPVDRVQVIRDRETGEPRGYGFVTFNSAAPQAAASAMAALNGAALDGAFGGRTIRVSPSNKWRGSDGGGGGAGGAGGAAANGVQLHVQQVGAHQAQAVRAVHMMGHVQMAPAGMATGGR